MVYLLRMRINIESYGIITAYCCQIHVIHPSRAPCLVDTVPSCICSSRIFSFSHAANPYLGPSIYLNTKLEPNNTRFFASLQFVQSQNESAGPPLGELITKVDRVGGNHSRSQIGRVSGTSILLPFVLFLTYPYPSHHSFHSLLLATRSQRRD
jgi:hypothetical protein